MVIRFRRRTDDEVPVQTRYNLPLEIFYTIVPVMMVIVFFYWTVDGPGRGALRDEPTPTTTVEVVGQQWSWTFNYGVGGADAARRRPTSRPATTATTTTSTRPAPPADIPTLWLPVDETVQFDLHSPDVIHEFWVPAFLDEDGRRPRAA